ncbi:MAG: DegT/DnrJ/EryC1/StrS family aminotransferase, partial [Micromonosporaceae bacterium]
MRIPFNDLAAVHAPILDDVLGDFRDIAGGSGFIGGAYVERFEESFAAYCGTRYAVGVANGTDAIELTLRALDIGRGDEVLVPANTFIATAEAVTAAGALPRFVDVDPDTLLVTPETLEAGRTARTVAVIAVHLYGHPADLDAIGRYADRHDLALLEDSAQAHGALLDVPGAARRHQAGPRRAGSYGRAGTFSFYPGKNLGAWGDGGAVVTDDAELAAELRVLANHGRDTERDSHRRVGRNSRLDALQAAVLHRKLATLDADNAARRRIVARYRAALGPLAEDLVQPTDPDASVWHLLVLRAGRRDALRRTLSRAGIATGLHYPV